MQKTEKKYRWDAIKERFANRKTKIIGVEVGVWRGQMSARLLKEMPNLYLYMVDRWAPPPKGDSYFQGSLKIAYMKQTEFDKAYQDAILKTQPFKNRCKILKMELTAAAELIPDKSCDFVFEDADHSYKGAKRSCEIWFPKIKKGGWLCGHDYDHPEQGEVKRAIDEMFGDRVQLSYNRTWFVQVE